MITISKLKEQIFEVGGLDVDWDDEPGALAQIEADAHMILADLVEKGELSSEECKSLLAALMATYSD